MTREQREALAALLPAGAVRLDEPMALHSSISAGGPAEAFAVAATIAELKRIIAWAQENRIEHRFWGGGTNTLVRDKGVRGLVVKLTGAFDAMAVEREADGTAYASIGAATPTAKFVRWAIDGALLGGELLAGVWGTMGGNVMTNAGTSAGAIGDIIEEATIVDREGRELSLKKGSALRFEYRRARIPRTAAVVRALLALPRASREDAERAASDVMMRRSDAQPSGTRSLGCAFKNPGKVSAGMLIEDAGLKGVRVGGARVSPVHANFIVNEGKATARDIIVLMNLIREKVRESFSISLEPEIEIIGDE